VRFAYAATWMDPASYLPMARAADESGWWACACSEHIANPQVTRSRYPYTDTGDRRWDPFTPWPDPAVAIASMAAVTEQLNFFTNVYVMPLRSPFAVAKTWGTLAFMSENRVSLGIGMGWMEEEFEMMEQPFARRGKRCDEMLQVVRTLWSGGWVEHHGEFYDFDSLEMNPAPTAPVPILVGGLSEAALRRAARNDGWISDLQSTADLAEVCATLRGYREELGTSDRPFTIVGSANDAADVDGYRRLEEVGVDVLLTWPWVFYTGFKSDAQQRVDGIRRFADEVIAKF
jgi:probable F420-dependent oxidoreductase